MSTLPTGEFAKAQPDVRSAATKIIRLRGSYRKQRRAAAAVEFAIVAPLFVMLVFGMIEYGRMIMVQQIITNAAREGARRAVLDTSTPETIENGVRGYLESCSIRATGNDKQHVTVTIPNTLPESGEEVTVAVSMSYDHVSWMPAFFLEGRTMAASSTMRRE